MLSPRYVDAVVVTHAGTNISPVTRSLECFGSVTVWDNQLGPNIAQFGQFLAACQLCTSDVVYFQDDDCVTFPEEILRAWEPGKIVCNMGTEGHAANYVNRPDKLMGFGSCFERRLIRPTFEDFWKKFPIDWVSCREAGRVFTAMNSEKVKVIEVPFKNMPWATDPSRLYKQPDHAALGLEALRRVKEVRGL